MGLGWTRGRAIRLLQLDSLLGLLAGLNHGSGFLENVQRCIDIAEALRASNLADNEISFIQFLKDKAVEERSGSDGKALRRGAIDTLEMIGQSGGKEVVDEDEGLAVSCTGSWCAEQANSALMQIGKL